MNMLKYRLKTFIKYQDLVKEIVSRDLKLKYRRSFLGYLWSMLNPLLIMIVLTLVFSTMFAKDINNYPLYLLSGRMLYDFLKTSTTGGMKSVTGNASLLKKVYVPKYIFTFAHITSCLVDHLLSYGALLIVMLFTHSEFHWTMIFMPVVSFELYLFCCGLGFFLAQLQVFFRDIQYIYQAVTTAWLYLTPILYPISKFDGHHTMKFVIETLNPLTYYCNQMRAFVYEGTLPTLKDFAGGWIIAGIALLIGCYFFQRSKDRFILYI